MKRFIVLLIWAILAYFVYADDKEKREEWDGLDEVQDGDDLKITVANEREKILVTMWYKNVWVHGT
jgi:hypothetical protein